MHLQNLALALDKTIAMGFEQDRETGVKSAVRALQILELIDTLGRSVTVCEISAILQIPQSSTSMLLKSMAGAGYLAYDRWQRNYSPTSRVALLGRSAALPWMQEGPLLQAVHRVNERLGRTTVIALRNGLAARYAYVVQGAEETPFYSIGSIIPLTASSTGLALIAHLPDDEIKRLALRTNLESAEWFHSHNLSSLIEYVEAVRRNGYSRAIQNHVNRSMISVPVSLAGGERIALSVGDTMDALNENEAEIIVVLNEEISRFRSDEHAMASALSKGGGPQRSLRGAFKARSCAED